MVIEALKGIIKRKSMLFLIAIFKIRCLYHSDRRETPEEKQEAKKCLRNDYKHLDVKPQREKLFEINYGLILDFFGKCLDERVKTEFVDNKDLNFFISHYRTNTIKNNPDLKDFDDKKEFFMKINKNFEDRSNESPILLEEKKKKSYEKFLEKFRAMILYNCSSKSEMEGKCIKAMEILGDMQNTSRIFRILKFYRIFLCTSKIRKIQREYGSLYPNSYVYVDDERE